MNSKVQEQFVVSPNWKTILPDIEKERAVLLIGQDFLPTETDSVLADFNKHLAEQLDKGEQYFYIRDGLFLFNDPVSKMEAQNEADAFFQGLKPDEEVLRKIAELPFPLIISVNPDIALAQYFNKRQLNFQFDYFSTKAKAISNPVIKPTAAYPLIYNLCGSIEDYQSLVLDFDDLFDLLRNLLADFGVPEAVSSVLSNATTYIFLGFKFEKWYTQLLLRYLNKNANRFLNTNKNHAAKTIIGDTDTQQFFRKQFNLNIYGADWQFLHDLHAEYAAQKNLRQLSRPVSEKAAFVRRLIQKNDVTGALEYLTQHVQYLDATEQDEIAIYQSQHQTWLENKRDKTVSQENLDVQINKVKKGVLQLTQKLA